MSVNAQSCVRSTLNMSVFSLIDLLRQQEELRRLEELRSQDRMRRAQELEIRYVACLSFISM